MEAEGELEAEVAKQILLYKKKKKKESNSTEGKVATSVLKMRVGVLPNQCCLILYSLGHDEQQGISDMFTRWHK